MEGEGGQEAVPSRLNCFRYSLDLTIFVGLLRSQILHIYCVVISGGGHFHQGYRRLVNSVFVMIPACAARLLCRTFVQYVLSQQV